MKADFICNHCKTGIDIHRHELYELFKSGRHEIECPHCDETVYIEAIATYTFEVTDEDGDEIID